ncbi:MAG: polyphosphate polymerase domain-containing protein [Lachnospiraceae bacterium]|nr:polyphosphate polymerase domain-containing protein [Lachnospiraceae bacterium]
MSASAVQYTFKRYEKKYLLTQEQYRAILPALKANLKPDEFGVHSVLSIYYDTDNFDLIRRSLESPAYKEKFRVRSYGVPEPETMIFAEIKKKYDGVVYKRRVDGLPGQIDAFIHEETDLDGDPQIQREIHWFMHQYPVTPKVFIGCERVAMLGMENTELRVTFDWNLRWRTDKLDLREGSEGYTLLTENQIVMEIKTPDSIPLWLVSALSACGAYPTGFSKYGYCYEHYIAPGLFRRERFTYA